MKTKLNSIIARLTGMTLGLALVVGLAGAAKAQFKPTSPEGIAASPRLQQQLNDRAAGRTATRAASATMACAKCKDEYVTRTDVTARGANKPVVTVGTHQCARCSTTIAVEGHGKAARDVASHACGAATAACCSMAK